MRLIDADALFGKVTHEQVKLEKEIEKAQEHIEDYPERFIEDSYAKISGISSISQLILESPTVRESHIETLYNHLMLALRDLIIFYEHYEGHKPIKRIEMHDEDFKEIVFVRQEDEN